MGDRRFHRLSKLGWLMSVAALALLLETVTIAQTLSFRVIVNPANTMKEADRTFLSRAFLKKLTRWPDGTPIRPVDLHPDSSVRRAFDEDVLNRAVGAVRNYWQQAIFAGTDVPPPELDSDAAVVDYVLRYPGAIGYVSPNANLKGAHILEVR